MTKPFKKPKILWPIGWGLRLKGQMTLNCQMTMHEVTHPLCVCTNKTEPVSILFLWLILSSGIRICRLIFRRLFTFGYQLIQSLYWFYPDLTSNHTFKTMHQPPGRQASILMSIADFLQRFSWEEHCLFCLRVSMCNRRITFVSHRGVACCGNCTTWLLQRPPAILEGRKVTKAWVCIFHKINPCETLNVKITSIQNHVQRLWYRKVPCWNTCHCLHPSHDLATKSVSMMVCMRRLDKLTTLYMSKVSWNSIFLFKSIWNMAAMY